MYADLQDPLDLIPKLYKKIEEGNDIVWAERRNIKTGIIEKIFSRLYAKLMQKFVIRTFPQKGFDIVMFNKKVKNELNQSIELNSSIYMQILSLGFKQDKIVYDKQPRKYGKSKWTLSKKIKMFIDSFVSFSYFPIRLVTIVGFILSFISIIWIIYIIFGTIFLYITSPGWPTLICVILFGFGITNISLGIIAEYLWRTLDSSRRRKAFIIDKIYDISK
jgi:dolichol-phosphate mannosyltransferase